MGGEKVRPKKQLALRDGKFGWFRSVFNIIILDFPRHKPLYADPTAMSPPPPSPSELHLCAPIQFFVDDQQQYKAQHFLT